MTNEERLVKSPRWSTPVALLAVFLLAGCGAETAEQPAEDEEAVGHVQQALPRDMNSCLNGCMNRGGDLTSCTESCGRCTWNRCHWY